MVRDHEQADADPPLLRVRDGLSEVVIARHDDGTVDRSLRRQHDEVPNQQRIDAFLVAVWADLPQAQLHPFDVGGGELVAGDRAVLGGVVPVDPQQVTEVSGLIDQCVDERLGIEGDDAFGSAAQVPRRIRRRQRLLRPAVRSLATPSVDSQVRRLELLLVFIEPQRASQPPALPRGRGTVCPGPKLISLLKRLAETPSIDEVLDRIERHRGGRAGLGQAAENLEEERTNR